MNEHVTVDLYKDIAPAGTTELIYRLAECLSGKSLLHVNSTRYGGGVAEMLHRLVPMFNSLNINTSWEVMEGTPLFYQTTKSFHNALQGQQQIISDEMFKEYLKINKQNVRKVDFQKDVVIIHDPQPAVYITKKTKASKWLWRCHIDISRPNRKVWNFLKEYVSLYDGAIFSLPSFAQKLNISQFLMYPSIDPLSDKNKELGQDEIDSVLRKFSIPTDKPIILQVSRFDRFKDPSGVIDAYKLVKKSNDCCLVLAGGSATDDPEGLEVLNEIKEKSSQDKDIIILNLPPDANVEINALQRAATIILQKSTKEGFGLTVAEAMWKGKPVIGGAVGGINTQIVYDKTGFTVNSIEGCAFRIRYLLNNPDILSRIGSDAKEYTRRNFLITRHVCDYLSLMLTMIK